MGNKAISVVGSINMDYVSKLDRLPEAGETIQTIGFSYVFGGKGANQAVAAARLGCEVKMIGMVGSDATGHEMLRNLAWNGVDASSVRIAADVDGESVPSGMAMINIDNNGDNTIVVNSGANSKLTIEIIKRYRDVIENSACLLLQLETPIEVVSAAAAIAAQKNVKVILNPSPATKLPDTLLSNCTYITPNQSELELITGIETTDYKGIEKAANFLIEKGVKKVIVTLGAKGSCYFDKDTSFAVPSIKIDSVDATGAGDSYVGALASIIYNNQQTAEDEQKLSPDDLLFCNAAGAFAATKLGAQTSLPNKEDILALIKTANQS